MKKWFGSILVVTGLLSLVPSLRAQAVYTASRRSQIQAGAGYLYLHNDYAGHDQGLSGWVDANLTPLLGLEAEAHFGVIVSPTDIGENSFFVGPRFGIRRGKFQPYAKAMVGHGSLVHDLPGHSSTLGYIAYALGGGLDYRIRPSFNFRAVDFEYQTWPTFSPHNLTPYTISSGLMYIIH
jgi:hypothetical protein